MGRREVPDLKRPVVRNVQTAVAGLISIGDRAETVLPPGLLRFLMEKDDGAPPIATRTHPMSGIPLGIAIESAIAAVGGRENGISILRACRCSYESPIRLDEQVVASAEVSELGVRHVGFRVKVSSSGDHRVILMGELILVRVGAGGRADPLGELYAQGR